MGCRLLDDGREAELGGTRCLSLSRSRSPPRADGVLGVDVPTPLRLRFPRLFSKCICCICWSFCFPADRIVLVLLPPPSLLYEVDPTEPAIEPSTLPGGRETSRLFVSPATLPVASSSRSLSSSGSSSGIPGTSLAGGMDVGTTPILLEVDEGLPLSVDLTGEVDVDVEVDDEDEAV